MKRAPICIFVYKNLQRVKTSIEILLECKDVENHELYIFSDGYKGNFDKPLVYEVRNYIKNVKGFKKVNMIESETNKGYNKQFLPMCDFVFSNFDYIMINDDDNIYGKFYLEFMDSALSKYKSCDKVYAVSSFLEKYINKNELPNYFFSKCIHRNPSFGFYKRNFLLFKSMLNNINNVIFNLDKNKKREFEYLSGWNIIDFLRSGGLSIISIDYLIFLNQFLHNKLSFFTKENFVINKSTDGLGEYTPKNDLLSCDNNLKSNFDANELPDKIEECELATKKIASFWELVSNKVFGRKLILD